MEPRSHPGRCRWSGPVAADGALPAGVVTASPPRGVRPDPSGAGLHEQRVPDSHRGGPISAEPRINDRIRVPEVRLVGPEGEQVGIVPIGEALRLAQDADLDLVEVAPMARPPVCKLMDYGKFKYESAQKAREARRNQALTVIKEMKLRPKIDPHDYETKKGHVVRFLKAGDKVKVTIMFRGREQSRPELGFRLLQRLAEDVAGARLRRVLAQAGRPQHDHGHGPAPAATKRAGRQGRRRRRAVGRRAGARGLTRRGRTSRLTTRRRPAAPAPTETTGQRCRRTRPTRAPRSGSR